MAASKKKLPPKTSPLEQVFAFHLRVYGIKAEREYRFHPTRKWRFDFAIPERLIAIEIDGGTFAKGAHSTGLGIRRDHEKDAEAICLGWRVIRVDAQQVKSGQAIRWLRRTLDPLLPPAVPQQATP